MKRLLTFTSLLVLIPALALACCGEAIYNDPGDTHEGKPVVEIKWSGLIKPAQLHALGSVAVRFITEAGVVLFDATVPWSSFVKNGLKWQYKNDLAKSVGGVGWLEFASHNDGWRIALIGYDDRLLAMAETVCVAWSVDGVGYAVSTLWKKRTGSPKGWHQYGLKP